MATTYTTSEGEVLDKIIWNFYGYLRPGMLESVLNANPHLADYGPQLPDGIVITFPDLKPTPARSKRLWD